MSSILDAGCSMLGTTTLVFGLKTRVRGVKTFENLQKLGGKALKKCEKVLNFLQERRLDPSPHLWCRLRGKLRWDKRGLRYASRVGGNLGKVGEVGCLARLRWISRTGGA
jgi:hypothetical protein